MLTEQTLHDILTELNAIWLDFVQYLIAKEWFGSERGTVIINGTEADLLGLYLHGGRAFPKDATFLILDGPILGKSVFNA